MATKQIVVFSGLAGAGKTTAARAMEDLGFFVVDNLPPQLIETLVSLVDSSGQELQRIALVIDAREATFLDGFEPTWQRLQKSGHDLMLLFLDCSDDVLVRRFKETRRRHPLGDGKGIRTGIARERALLEGMSHLADEIINTCDFTVHDLKRITMERFGSPKTRRQIVTVMSFGFKHGVPSELDLCFDARFLPNPYFEETLRDKSGLDAPVSAFVRQQDGATTFLDKMEDLTSFLLPRYQQEGRSYVTLAVGCTGGRHRSVAMAEALTERLNQGGFHVRCVHRDVHRNRD